MKELRFYAREGLVRDPECMPVVGQAARYLGRLFEPSRKEGATVIPASHPANPDGFSCDAGGEIAKVAIKGTRKGAFWPADEATAAVCGVPFVEVEFKDGAFAPKPKATGAKPSKAAE